MRGFAIFGIIVAVLAGSALAFLSVTSAPSVARYIRIRNM